MSSQASRVFGRRGTPGEALIPEKLPTVLRVPLTPNLTGFLLKPLVARPLKNT